MSNPVFENTAVFRDPRRSRQRGQQGGQPGMVLQRNASATAGLDAATLDQMYNAPAATTAQTGRLTYDDVIVKTSGLLVLVAAAAAFAWFVVPDALRMPVALGGAGRVARDRRYGGSARGRDPREAQPPTAPGTPRGRRRAPRG